MEDLITFTCSSCRIQFMVSPDVLDEEEDLSCPVCEETAYAGDSEGRTPDGWYGGWEGDDDDEDDGYDDVEDEDDYPWVWPGSPIPGSGSGGRGKAAGLRQEVPRYGEYQVGQTKAQPSITTSSQSLDW